MAMPGSHRPEEIERRLRSARYVDRQIAGIEQVNGFPPSRRGLPTVGKVAAYVAIVLGVAVAVTVGVVLGSIAGPPASGTEWLPPSTYGAPGPTGGPQ